MNYKTGRALGQVLFLLSIFLLCIAVFFSLPEILVPILVIAGILAALAGLIVYFLFWRCPFCHKNLPTKSMYDVDLPELWKKAPVKRHLCRNRERFSLLICTILAASSSTA